MSKRETNDTKRRNKPSQNTKRRLDKGTTSEVGRGLASSKRLEIPT